MDSQTTTRPQPPLWQVVVLVLLLYGGMLAGAALLIHERIENQIVGGGAGAREFAQLDRSLVLFAVTAFVVGAAIITGTFVWADRRIRSTDRLLQERMNSLLQANEELAASAKASAIGMIMTNWLHDLKSPVFGLQTFLACEAGKRSGQSDQDWQSALRLTGQLQHSINEMMSLLRQDQGLEREQTALSKVFVDLSGRYVDLALSRGVLLEFLTPPELALSGSRANLLLLILGNLVRNAIEVSPRGAVVRLSARAEKGEVVLTVVDRGPGFPEELKRSLFRPCVSTKNGGSGVGLAISQHLAKQLGAELRLAASSAKGCEFALQLSGELFSDQPLVRTRS